ncbi:MAG TPA: rhomboid family intramembrane serine protease [Bacteroidia bacterium]|jgi:membrane associated rhomboid family serine protease|nr:rhomboid family intramembrane serine protease [Bacteroidia bacterium]
MANQLLEDIKKSIRNENPVTRLIVINVALFLCISFFKIVYLFSGYSLVVGTLEASFLRNITLPLSIQGLVFKPWTLITYMFAQEDIFHIFWNMISLYWFGKLLSYYTATKKIIPLYILGGIAGALFTILMFAIVPMFQSYAYGTLIGASASVTAIIVATATLIPEVRINLPLIGPVKLLYVAVFYIFIDVLNLASEANVGGNISHLGGALMGYVFIVQYKKGRDMSKWINRFFDWVGGLFKRSPRSAMKVAHKKAISDEEFNSNRKANQQTVDEILDKISKSGYESLTKAEKDILFKASNKI